MSGTEPRVVHSARTALDLTEAYHLVFDIKDALVKRPSDRYKAYEAANAIANLMQALEVEVPERFDGEGRQS